MNSKEYWVKREKDKLRANLRDATKTTKRINRAIDKGRDDMEKEIATLFSRYARDNKLTYQEATKLLTGEEFKSFRMDLTEYVKEINKTGNEELLLELNTLAMKSRISRLEEMLYQTSKVLDKDYEFKVKEVEELMKEGVSKSFTQTSYSIDKYLGFHASFNYINQSDIDSIISLPWSGRHFSKRLWSNRTKLKEKIEEQITQAIIQGKDLNKIIREVRDTMDVSKNVAARLINTEHAYACAQGDLKVYEELGIDKYEYSATLDTRTSNICRSLDGKVFKLEDATPGFNFPPMHPHCRSSTIPAVEDFKGSTRITRDRNGKNIYLKSNTTYREYRQAFKSGDWASVSIDKGGKSEYNELNRKLSRRKSNSGVFKDLGIVMQKKAVINIAKKFDIDLQEVTIKIQRDEDLINLNVYGSADYRNIGRIDLFPMAFQNEEQMIRTLVHEKVHVDQLKKYGFAYTQANLKRMEDEAYAAEDEFIAQLLKEGKINVK